MSETNNYAGRRWQITINNPQNIGLDDEALSALINKLKYTYACYAREVGESGTPHIHIYLCTHSAVFFSRLKTLFPTAHLETAQGRHKENIDYIRKTGKWADTDKAETTIPNSFREFGTRPTDRATAENRKEKLFSMIEQGMSNLDIMKEDKSFIYQSKHMDEIRLAMTEAKYAERNRELKVYYLTGASGTGKTRSIYEAHNPSDVCRITTYRQGGQVYFDSYIGQDVLVFEEFSGQVPITDMLNYLDIYPLKLPARYNDKQACYTTVYITSNIPIDHLYKNEQYNEPETYNALLRRIDAIFEYDKSGNIKKRNPKEFVIANQGKKAFTKGEL